MSAVLHDIRLAVRLLSRRPGLNVAVALTLAVGIAVGTVAFAVVNAAFLRPPDVAEPARLVNLYTTRADGSGHGALSYPDFIDLAAATSRSAPTSSVFADVAGYSGLMATWSSEGHASTLFGEIVTGSYFETLGIRPALGRLLTPDDDRIPGQQAVIVLGHAFWRNRLGADPDVVGRILTISGRPYTVVGVAPASFTGSLFRGFAVDVWAPTMMMGALRTDQLANREERWLFVRARLAPGVPIERAAAAASAVSGRLALDHPKTNAGRTFLAVPTAEVWFSPDADGPLVLVSVLLIGSCLLVLVVGTANVLGLIGARLLGRSRDLALHAALGATRRRLFRQLLAEAAIVAMSGGLVGLALARAGAQLLSAYRPPLPLPLAFDVRVDWRVAAFAVSLTCAVAVLLSLASLRHLSRRDRFAGIRGELAGPARLGRSRRHWLLVPQVAGSALLLVLAAIGARSVAGAAGVDPGFDVDGVGMLTYSPATSGLDEGSARRFFEAVMAKAQAAPGVAGVALADRIPLDLYGNLAVTVSSDAGPSRGVQAAHVSPGYFEALGIRSTAGRAFDAADLVNPSAAAIVNEAFARKHWPGESAIGRPLQAEGRPVTVVGTVADVKVQTLGETPTPMIYVPLTERFGGLLRVIVRTTGEPGPVLDVLARDAAAIRSDVALFEQRTMAENVGLMLMPFVIASWLGAGLGLVAVALAAVGLHGLVAFAVAARMREFGVRLALGATRWQLAGAAAGETIRAAGLGLALGLVLAAVATRLLAAFVFGVSPWDPVSFGAATLATVAVSALAAAGPVRRAWQADPVSVLRAE